MSAPIVGRVVAPVAVDVISRALGRSPTRQELMDLAPLAVAVQAFLSSDQAGTVEIDYDQWDNSYLLGLVETSGQSCKVKIRKAKP